MYVIRSESFLCVFWLANGPRIRLGYRISKCDHTSGYPVWACLTLPSLSLVVKGILQTMCRQFRICKTQGAVQFYFCHTPPFFVRHLTDKGSGGGIAKCKIDWTGACTAKNRFSYDPVKLIFLLFLGHIAQFKFLHYDVSAFFSRQFIEQMRAVWFILIVRLLYEANSAVLY